MKKLFLFTLLLSFCALSASAEVDRFVSSTKYKVKTNPLAQMMENSTKKTMDKNKQNQQNVQNKKQQYNQQYNRQQNNVKKTTSGWT